MIDVGVASYSAGAILFALLSILVLLKWRDRMGGELLLLTVLVSTFWAAYLALFSFGGKSGSLGMLAAIDAARGIAWLALLWRLIVGREKSEAPPMLRYVFHGGWIGTVVMILLSHIYGYVTGDMSVAQSVFIGSGFLLAVVAFVLVEQLFRNSPDDSRWTLKFFCLAVGGMFAYDIYLFASGLLFMHLNPELWNARGAISAFSVPLIALSIARSATGTGDQFVSRRMVFYSTALLGVGFYLLIMAAGGYVVGYYGKTWGGFAQILFLCGALFLLGAVLFSGQVRATVKVFMNKHFFAYHYDYREVWQNLTRSLSLSDDDNPLAQRAIVAAAGLVDSPAGALWLLQDGRYQLMQSWNTSVSGAVEEPAGSSLCRFLRAKEWIIDLTEIKRRPELYDGLELPSWLANRADAWLITPLMQADNLLGFIVLSRSRAMRELTWEDHDLLKTVGRQTAGHLALNQSVQMLAETRQFQAYNRLTAFIMHDLKNVIAQQSLVVKNAAKHKDKPEFVDDAIATVDNSVKRMHRLLDQLRRGSGDGGRGIARIANVLRDVIAQNSQREPLPQLRMDGEENLRVEVEPSGLTMVLGHMVRNAQEATETDGNVTLVARRDGEHVIIEIRDSGSGMSAEFMSQRLFRPFDTTKGSKGMGIGVYQAREFMRAVGGTLDVESELQHGSVFRVRLPLATAADTEATTMHIGASGEQ